MKRLFFFLTTLFLVGSVLASPLQDLMSDNATNMTIILKQNETFVNFYLNTEAYDWANQPISYQGYSLDGFSISSLLKAIRFRVDSKSLSNYSEFSNITIRQNTLVSSVLDFVLNYLNLGFNTQDINNNNSLLTSLIKQHSPPLEIIGNSYVQKSGDYTYQAYYDKGFGSIPSGYLDRAEEVINKSVYLFNAKKSISKFVSPIANFQIPSLNSLDYNVSIDLSNLKIENGNYTIKFNATNGMETIQKEINVILDGIVTTENYTVSDENVSKSISLLAGFQKGTTFSIGFLSGYSSPLQNYELLKAFEINASKNTSATIYFSILSSQIKNPAKVRLYTIGNDTLTELETTYLGENASYQDFKALTPHFSTFLALENRTSETAPTTPSSSGGGSGGGDSRVSKNVQATQSSPVNPAPSCEEGQTQCSDGKDLMQCLNGNWVLGEVCEFQCFNGACTQTLTPEKGQGASITGQTISPLGQAGFLMLLLAISGILIVLLVLKKAKKQTIKKL